MLMLELALGLWAVALLGLVAVAHKWEEPDEIAVALAMGG